MTYKNAKDLYVNLVSAEDWWEYMIANRLFTREGTPYFLAPGHTWIDRRARIGANTVVFPGCVIMGYVAIGKNCVIMSGSTLIGEEITEEERASGKSEMRLGDNCLVYPNTTLLNVEAGDGVTLGLPHQKNSKIGDKSVIGALAEFNRSILGKNVKDVHNSYLGDATVGDGSNIGAGTITANFDGKNKHKTIFGPNCSTGVNTSIIAPNEFPEGTSIAAGSLIIANIKNVLQKLGQELRPYSLLRSLVLNFKVTPKEK